MKVTNWRGGSDNYLLHGCGPVDVAVEVQASLSQPSRPYLGRAYDQGTLDPLVALLRDVFETEEGVAFPIAGSARSCLEAAATSTTIPGDPVVCICTGIFGYLLAEIFGAVQANVHRFEVAPGALIDFDELDRFIASVKPVVVAAVHNETSTGATYDIQRISELAHRHNSLVVVDVVSSLGAVPVRTDAWKLDIAVSASQKCLGAPVGLGLICIRPTVWKYLEARERVVTRSYTYDLQRWRRSFILEEHGGLAKVGAPRITPLAISSQSADALSTALAMIFKEGLDHRFRRHHLAAEALRAGIRALGLELVAHPSIQSDTVSTVRFPASMQTSEVWEELRNSFGIEVSLTPAPLADCLRFGTMGMTASPERILYLLSALEIVLHRAGIGGAEMGAPLKQAQHVFIGGML